MTKKYEKLPLFLHKDNFYKQGGLSARSLFYFIFISEEDLIDQNFNFSKKNNRFSLLIGHGVQCIYSLLTSLQSI